MSLMGVYIGAQNRYIRAGARWLCVPPRAWTFGPQLYKQYIAFF